MAFNALRVRLVVLDVVRCSHEPHQYPIDAERHTGGQRPEWMVRKYIREANLFRDNAAAKVGL